MRPGHFNHHLFDIPLVLVSAFWIWFLFAHADLIFGH